MKSVRDDGEHPPDSSHPLSLASPLSGDTFCIAHARHLAAGFLTRAQSEQDVTVSDRAMDLTQLVVSELVTNAHRHAPGPIHMELRITGTMVEVTVQDSTRVQPAAHSLDPGRVGQHGLEIVMAVAEHFDVRLEPSGKRVTAHIALADRHAPTPPPVLA
ncbi:ATP-binding protein [Streptomyces sp. BH-SS-21]|uniref:ATP-binding protein n=1 Tax=Streptomyces liliiviolaceus TaxID=2823109 RepID=A0A941B7J6_9ACTN|nr:ATP-binding protein [Streptomyces liliiviolaceus]MBQ0850556.1 ATP-binding protein [Streptomyces liliiviolaceus]